MPHDPLVHDYLDNHENPTLGGFATYMRVALSQEIHARLTCDEGSCAYCDALRDAIQFVATGDAPETAEGHPDLRFGTPSPAVRVPLGALQDLLTGLEEAALRDIEARNPGIDIERVRRERAARGDFHPVVHKLPPAVLKELGVAP